MTYYLIAAAISAVVLLFNISAFRAIAARPTSTGRHKNALRLELAGVQVVAAAVSLFFVQMADPGSYNLADYPAAPRMNLMTGIIGGAFVGAIMIVRGNRVATIEERLRRQRVQRLKAQDRCGIKRHLHAVAS